MVSQKRATLDIASQMIMFARVVEEGGFSAAARALDFTPSAVSKQITRLEERLGVRLLNRSTRTVTLTDEGSAFYDRCVRVSSEVEAAEQEATQLGGRVRGTLRVAATVAFAKEQLLPLIPDFLESYPELRVALEVTDRHVDLVEENVNVAIRFSEQLDDPNIVARRLAINRRVVCAAPEYLDAHGTPQAPEELCEHNCLVLYTVSGFNEWEFEGPEGSQIVRVSGNFETNSADALYRAALAGIGIARLSTYLVGPDLRSGKLKRVLPQFAHEKAFIFAIYPQRRHLSPKVRAFIDFLVEKFSPVPPWEIDEN